MRRERRISWSRTAAFVFCLLVLAFVWTAAPARAFGEIRLVAASDTPGANYIDLQIPPGESRPVELWVQSDTFFNGFSAWLSYDGTRLRLEDAAAAGDSFPASLAGVQTREDRTTFGHVLFNRGGFSGATTETFHYAAVTTADSVIGSFRAAILFFRGLETGIQTVTYVMDTPTNRITAVTRADGFGTNILPALDSGVLHVTHPDTPVIQLLTFSSDTPARFFDAAPFDTAPGGDTVWFAAETQVVTLTVNFTSTHPDSISVGAIFDSGARIDTTPPYTAVFAIRPGHAASETTTVLSVFSITGTSDTLLIRFRPDTAAPDTVTPLAPIGGSVAETPTFRWTPSADTDAGVRRYIVQVSDSSTFATILASETTAHPDTDLILATPLTNGVHWWRVLAVDAVGNVALSGLRADTFFRSDDAIPPGIFHLTAPVNGTETSATTITFRWTAAADSTPPVTYRLVVDTDMLGAVVGETTVTETFATLSLPANDTYRWRVIARDFLGWERTVGDSILIIDTAPPPPAALLMPANNQITGDSTPAFYWSASVDTGTSTRGYVIQISGDSTFASVAESAFVTTTNHTSTGLADSTWFWRVIPHDTVANADTAAAVIWRFVIDSGVPVIAAIEIVSSIPVRFFADSPIVPGMIADTVWFNPNFEQTCTITVFIRDTNESFVTGSPAFVVVRGIDTGLDRDSYEIVYRIPIASASATLTFEVTDAVGFMDTALVRFEADSTPPSAVAPIAPVHLTDTRATMIAFSWGAAVDAGSGLAGYRLQVDSSPAFAPPRFDSATTLTAGILTLPANDTYWWRVVTVDRVGNETFGAAFRLRVDTAPPDSPILVTRNGETVVAPVTLVWGAAQDALTGVAWYVVQIDTSGAFTALVDSMTLSWNDTDHLLPALAADTYWWRVLAIDSVGNVAVSNPVRDSFRLQAVDTRPPDTFTLVSPADLTSTRAVSITLRWQDALDSSPPVTYRIQVDTAGTFVSPWIDTSWHVETWITLVFPANNTHWWRVIARDAHGNTRPVAANWRIVVDTLAPIPGTLSLPLANHDTNRTTINFSWTAASDVLSGVAGYRLQVAATPAFAVLLRDSFTSLTTQVLTLPANDTYFWRVLAIDSAGNVETYAPARRLRVDTLVPVPGTLSLPVADHDTNVTTIGFSWTAASDALSGVAGYRLQVAATPAFAVLLRDSFTSLTTQVLTLPANDTYFWRVLAIDSAGNVETYAPARRLRVDTLAPVPGTLLLPVADHDTNVTTIGFVWIAASDALSGVAGYRLQVAASPAFTVLLRDSFTALTTQVLTLPANDTYWWRVLAIDSAGNVETYAPARRLRIDTTPADILPPDSFSLVLPAHLTETRVATITFSWQAAFDSSPPVTYQLIIDTDMIGASVRETTVTAISATLILPANNTYWWRVIARDTHGNSRASTETWRIAIDTAPPPPAGLLVPVDGQTIADTTPTFSWSAAVDTGTGTRGYVIQISGDSTFAVIAQSAFVTTTNHTSPGLMDSTWFWRVISHDTVANADTAAAVVRRFVIASDTIPPDSFSLVSPAHLTETRVATITFSWQAAFDSSPPITYQLIIDTDMIGASVRETTVTATSATFTLPANDTYWWRVIARDTHGNSRASTETWRIVVDTLAPASGTLSLPVADLLTRDLTIGFAWTAASDALSGVAGYRLQVSTLATFATLVADSPTGLLLSETVTLPAGNTYFWRVLTIDDAGNVETYAPALRLRIDTTPPLTEIVDSPLALIRAGDDFLSIVSTFGDTYRQVEFLYRAAGSGAAWRRCTPTAGSANPDTVGPFWGFFWDISDRTIFTNGGEFDVIARATTMAGDTDPNPGYIRVTIDRVDSTHNEFLTAAGAVEVNRLVPRDTPTIIIYVANITPGLHGTMLEVPAGALPDTQWFRITIIGVTPPADAPLAAGFITDSIAIFHRFEVVGRPNATFARPLTITLPYDDLDTVADFVGRTAVRETDLAIHYYDRLRRRWMPLPSTVDPVRNVVIATTTHFTVFKVAGLVPAAPNLSNVIVYPNPWVPDDGNPRTGIPYDGTPNSGIIFENLPQQVTIEIYNIAGKLVSRMQKNSILGRYHWNGQSDDRRDVASGVYLAVIRSGAGEQVVRKIMIIR